MSAMNATETNLSNQDGVFPTRGGRVDISLRRREYFDVLQKEGTTIERILLVLKHRAAGLSEENQNRITITHLSNDAKCFA